MGLIKASSQVHFIPECKGMLISQQVNISRPLVWEPQAVSKSKKLAVLFVFMVHLPPTYTDTMKEEIHLGMKGAPWSRKQAMCLGWHQVPKYFIGMKTKTQSFTITQWLRFRMRV